MVSDVRSSVPAAIFAQLYRWYFATLRITALLPDGSTMSASDYAFGSEIYALAERDSVTMAGLTLGRRFTVLVAHGRDGDWASATLEALGCRIVRGSSRLGGASAFITLVRDRRVAGGPAALVVDGPLGPPGVAKAGAAMLAVKTGLPLRILGVAVRHRVVLRGTWAGFEIAWPFARVVIAVQDVSDPASAGDLDHDALARELTRELARARQRATAHLRHPRRVLANPEGAASR